MSEYGVHDYSRMIADEVRTAAFVAAMRQVVKPGAVVLDIGTGTGFFAVLACQLGARAVHAIEPGDAIQVAREVARENGCADRIRFYQGVSTAIDLPERADVIVSDLRGVLPLYTRHLPSIVDARRRHLAEGGTLIGVRDTLIAAVVEAPELYESYGLARERRPFGVAMEASRSLELHAWRRGRVEPGALLAPAQVWASLDHAHLEAPDVRGEVRWTAAREGTAHGLLLWFDAELADGIRLSNAPDRPELVYGSAFFPWLRPVAVAPGDQVRATLDARLVGDEYQWRWTTEVCDADGARREAFQQSTFHGAPLSPERIKRSAANYTASLREPGRMARFVLERMHGQATVAEIAAAVRAQFPNRFATAKEALAYVAELSVKYG